MTNPSAAQSFRETPIDARRVLRLAGRRTLVVVAPHPDDETLGCGGLIAAAVAAGVRVAVVSLTDGEASHPGSRRWPPRALAAVRRGELRRALARLGAGRARIGRLGWSDGGVAATGRLVRLRRVLARLDPGVVLVTSPRDHHPDHQAACRLVAAALAATRVPLVAYAVWSRVGNPRRRAVAPHRVAKRWAIAAHRSQVGGYISDDPAGFRLVRDVAAQLVAEPERFAMLARRPSAGEPWRSPAGGG